MKYLRPCLFGFMLFHIMGCSLLPESENTLLSSEQALINSSWELAATFDSYDGFWREVDPGSFEKVIEFYEDKSFTEFRIGGDDKQVGIWRLSGDKLLLHYTDNSNVDLNYEVRDLSTERLDLAWQGRHGPVINRYQHR